MSEYVATIRWKRCADERYVDNKYSRAHEWQFDGGAIIPASASHHIVPLPYSVEANVDPEEAFVAALSSCHMLFFLSIAAKNRYVVNEYVDHAIGVMGKDAFGKTAITKVMLRPMVQFSGETIP
ncbi:MAG: OsmC family protein, partial [Planctomycetales bacterium]|nr:OsmC family protein [Planctomycetales bacterium]